MRVFAYLMTAVDRVVVSHFVPELLGETAHVDDLDCVDLRLLAQRHRVLDRPRQVHDLIVCRIDRAAGGRGDLRRDLRHIRAVRELDDDRTGIVVDLARGIVDLERCDLRAGQNRLGAAAVRRFGDQLAALIEDGHCVCPGDHRVRVTIDDIPYRGGEILRDTGGGAADQRALAQRDIWRKARRGEVGIVHAGDLDGVGLVVDHAGVGLAVDRQLETRDLGLLFRRDLDLVDVRVRLVLGRDGELRPVRQIELGLAVHGGITGRLVGDIRFQLDRSSVHACIDLQVDLRHALVIDADVHAEDLQRAQNVAVRQLDAARDQLRAGGLDAAVELDGHVIRSRRLAVLSLHGEGRRDVRDELDGLGNVRLHQRRAL